VSGFVLDVAIGIAAFFATRYVIDQIKRSRRRR
jgi:hypothetical protein